MLKYTHFPRKDTTSTDIPVKNEGITSVEAELSTLSTRKTAFFIVGFAAANFWADEFVE